MRHIGIAGLGLGAFVLCSHPATAAEPRRPAEAIQDNSFLVEEAYNQEAGVVQHILTMQFGLDRQGGRDERTWDLGFTQEWPVFSQRHQVSYTVPYSFIDASGESQNGFGDVLLNYRFQALFESEGTPAFAPRVSIVLPTGDASKGLGLDTLGWQFNLPVSKIVHDRLTLHANAGLTLFPGLNDRNPVSYRLAGSAIYAATSDFNLLLELLGDWVETANSDHRMERGFEAVISPGIRYAINGTIGQAVLGVAVPIGLTRDAPDIGVFLYVSFEHLFRRSKN